MLPFAPEGMLAQACRSLWVITEFGRATERLDDPPAIGVGGLQRGRTPERSLRPRFELLAEPGQRRHGHARGDELIKKLTDGLRVLTAESGAR